MVFAFERLKALQINFCINSPINIIGINFNHSLSLDCGLYTLSVLIVFLKSTYVDPGISM